MMEAGRDLDALIAEKVMGYRVISASFDYISTKNGIIERGTDFFAPDEALPFGSIVPHYSTDIAAAFLVVEKIKALNPCGSNFTMEWWSTSNVWHVSLASNGYPDEFAKTLPHAICLFALALTSQLLDTPPK